jgi:hypothetical protein
MIRALRTLLGALAAIVALLMLALALWSATFTEHKVRSYEREHLEAAVKFVRDRELATGRIPDSTEFERWAREMDSRGYRFDGYGYALDHRCGSRSSEFCIGFWTGEAFVTYRSWQESMESVRIDDSPLPLAFGLLVAGLIAGIVGKLLLVPRRRMTGDGSAHDG